ncbi:MAG: helix-turn-helix domain-containing protein [Ktedonobacteraceae bacterium]
MQTASPVCREEGTRHVTLTAHTQAVERAIQTMHTHLHELLTLEDLASVACLSPYYFNRVFRHLIGIPPGEFLTALRFQMARHMLVATSLSVTDICFEVGYTSTGSFTSRFTQLVGLSPRLLRQRAHAFEPLPVLSTEGPGSGPMLPTHTPLKRALLGRISAPTTFRGTIYIGLFTSSIPQGAPVRCTRLSEPGWYLLPGLADGVYYLRTAAFPVANDLQTSLLPGKNILLGKNTDAIVIHNGHISGNPDLTLRPPRLTDPPLVMGLPLL